MMLVQTKDDRKRAAWPVMVVWIGILFCSTSGVFVRYSTAPTLVLAAYRKTFVTLMLLPFALKNHRGEIRNLGRKNLTLCFLSGFFLALHFFTYFESVQNTTITASQVLAGTEVIFVAVFMFLSGRERYSLPAKAGILIALAGGVLVSWTRVAGIAENAAYGNAMAATCAVFIAAYSFIGTGVRKNCSNTAYTFLVYGTAAVVLNLMIPFAGYSYVGYGSINYLTALGMAVCCSLLGHSLFNWSLKYVSPTLVAMFKVFQPVFATIWGILLFSEIPTWNQFVGGAIVIAGIILYTKAKAGGMK